MASGSGALTSGIPERSGPTFEGRAAVALKAVAAFAAVVGVILLGSQSLPLAPVVLLVTAAGFCLLALVAARGIDQRRPWALTAAPALLWILLAFGLLDVVIGLAASRIQIPLGALLAIWAFRAPPSVPRPAAEGHRGSALIAGFLVANTALSVGPTLAGPGGPFAAGEADLAVSLAADCGPPDAGVPRTVPVILRWSWSRGEPFPGGSDGIAIAWRGTDGEGGEPFLVDGVSPPAAEGIVQGGAAPSADVIDAFISTYGSGVSFAIDLAAQRFRPGEIALTLRRGSEVPVARGDLRVQAAYVHLGRWQVTTLPDTICQW